MTAPVPPVSIQDMLARRYPSLERVVTHALFCERCEPRQPLERCLIEPERAAANDVGVTLLQAIESVVAHGEMDLEKAVSDVTFIAFLFGVWMGARGLAYLPTICEAWRTNPHPHGH